MSRRILASSVLLATLGALAPAAARPVAAPRELPLNGLGLELIFDPQLMFEARYARRLPDVMREYDLTLEASIGAPLYLFSGMDAFEFTLGASSEIPLRGRFGITIALATSLATSENTLGRFVAWGLEVALLPGFYAARWFLALNLAWKPTLATHIEHSSYTRAAFDDRYPEGTPPAQQTSGPEDGWYAFPVHRWVAGLVGGYSFGRRVTLYSGAGISSMAQDPGFFSHPSLGVLPFYAQLGVCIRW